jgi:hypothetical protein
LRRCSMRSLFHCKKKPAALKTSTIEYAGP